MKYIVYNKDSGEIWQGLDQYGTTKDGTIVGSINGANTLRYAPQANVAILETSQEQWQVICQEGVQHYRVINSEIVRIKSEEESQLDRIEANTASLKADIEQDAVDAYTLELMESGII